MDGADSQLIHNRHKQGCAYQNACGVIDYHPHDEQEDINDEQQYIFIGGDAHQKLQHQLRHTVNRKHAAQHQTAYNHNHDGTNRAGGLLCHCQEALKGTGPVYPQSDGDGIDGCHGSRLGGCKHAPVDSAQYDEGHDKGRHSLEGHLPGI